MKHQQFRTKEIFSSSDDDKSSEETDDASNEGESSKETNDSDEEADPWRALTDEATAELHTKHSELGQSLENEGFSEIDAKQQAFCGYFARASKGIGKCLYGSPAMDDATEKGSCT